MPIKIGKATSFYPSPEKGLAQPLHNYFNELLDELTWFLLSDKTCLQSFISRFSFIIPNQALFAYLNVHDIYSNLSNVQPYLPNGFLRLRSLSALSLCKQLCFMKNIYQYGKQSDCIFSISSSPIINECLHECKETFAYKAFTVNYHPDGSITGHSKIWQRPESHNDHEELYIWQYDTRHRLSLLCLHRTHTEIQQTERLCEQAEGLTDYVTTIIHMKVQESDSQIGGLQKTCFSHRGTINTTYISQFGNKKM